jgi:type VII secretion-associated serine protease mycosin
VDNGPVRVVVRAWVAVLLAVVLAALTLPVCPAWAGSGDLPWQLATLHVQDAWQVSTGAGVTVAVLDSGVDSAHADLAGRVLPGFDFVDGTTDGRRDFVGHGTTVAGLIAGRDDTAMGVAGIAPRAKILPVRVLDRANRYADATVVAKGLRWAVDHGARVVNMSLGGTLRSSSLADAIAYAFARDVVVVACTGNVISGQPNTVWYPAREPGVVAVAGLTQTPTGLALWPGGLTGPDTVLTAPAVDLLGPRPGGYWQVEGTSFAASLVAGTAALIRSRWPTMSAANVINRLIGTADPVGTYGSDQRVGFGEVDPALALTATMPTVSHNPLLPSGPQPAGVPVDAGTSRTRQSMPTATTNVEAADAAAPAPVHHPADWGLAAGTVSIACGVGAGLLLAKRRRPG